MRARRGDDLLWSFLIFGVIMLFTPKASRIEEIPRDEELFTDWEAS
jgi:hypothetical protein